MLPRIPSYLRFTNGGIINDIRGGRRQKWTKKRRARKRKRGGKRPPIHDQKRYKALAKQGLKNVYRQSKNDVINQLKEFLADLKNTPREFFKRTKGRVHYTKAKIKSNAINEATRIGKREAKRIILRKIFG